MKRFLALALAVVFVLGFAAVAMAAHLDVTGNGTGLVLNGEYLYRAKAVNNINDLDDNSPDAFNFHWQRMRFIITSQISDDVKAITRLTMSNGDFNGTRETGGNDTGTEAGGDKNDNQVRVDWAYMTVKKLGGTWFVGRQPASWGNKLAAWGGEADRIKYVAKLSDMLTLGAVIQKDVETNGQQAATGNNGGGDQDSYYVLAVIKPVADHKIGLIYKTTNNNTPNGTATQVDATWMDIAYNGKAGPVSIAAEYSTSDTDAANTDKTKYFLMGSIDVSDMIGVSAAYAFAENGDVADNDFGATYLAGTNANAGAIMEFGEMQGNPAWGLATARDDEATALVVAADFKLSDDLSLGANIAQHTLSKAADVDALEIGVKAVYKVAQNTDLQVVYAQAALDIPVALSATDDPITSGAIQLRTKW